MRTTPFLAFIFSSIYSAHHYLQNNVYRTIYNRHLPVIQTEQKHLTPAIRLILDSKYGVSLAGKP